MPVELQAGPMILCGRPLDQVAAKESLALIRSLVRDDLTRVFTSHDAEAWATWHHAPDAYR